MPTVYSDKYWTGTYTYTRVRIDYSGTSATAILLYSRTNDYAGATSAGSPASFSFGGGSADMSYKAFYGRQTDAEVCRCNFTISTGGGTYSGATSGNAGLLGFSGSVTVPAQTSKPTGLTVALVEPLTNGAVFDVSISSFGVPSGVEGRYIEAGILAQNSYGPTYRFSCVLNEMASQITVTSTSAGGTLVINPNTQYYYGGYASNTVENVHQVAGQFVTTAKAPTVKLVGATDTTASFSYAFTADGGYYNRSVQYSLDNGATWTTAATVSGGSAANGTFTIEGLLSGSAYTMKIRSSTTAGATLGEDVLFDTNVSTADNRNIFYGSVNSEAKEITAFYGEVSGEAKRAIKVYGSGLDPDNFIGKVVRASGYPGVNYFNPITFKTKLMSDYPQIWANRSNFARLEVLTTPSGPNQHLCTLRLYLKDDVSFYTLVNNGSDADVALFGAIMVPNIPAQPTNDYIHLLPKQIAKLIHQAFGHIDYES